MQGVLPLPLSLVAHTCINHEGANVEVSSGNLARGRGFSWNRSSLRLAGVRVVTREHVESRFLRELLFIEAP